MAVPVSMLMMVTERLGRKMVTAAAEWPVGRILGGLTKLERGGGGQLDGRARGRTFQSGSEL